MVAAEQKIVKRACVVLIFVSRCVWKRECLFPPFYKVAPESTSVCPFSLDHNYVKKINKGYRLLLLGEKKSSLLRKGREKKMKQREIHQLNIRQATKFPSIHSSNMGRKQLHRERKKQVSVFLKVGKINQARSGITFLRNVTG